MYALSSDRPEPVRRGDSPGCMLCGTPYSVEDLHTHCWSCWTP